MSLIDVKFMKQGLGVHQGGLKKMKGHVISASRRTDIPAFYAKWFINRIRAGWCGVPNPFNRNQVSRISLRREDVYVICFWTRNARPLIPYLSELDELGYNYYFQYTVLGYPRGVDPSSPSLKSSIKAFSDLSDMVGPKRVIFRYDPILLNQHMDESFHLDAFEKISSALAGKTSRCVISIVDDYRKARGRMRELSKTTGFQEKPFIPQEHESFLYELSAISESRGMDIQSCAEDFDLKKYGIRPGKCIDDDLIKEVFGLDLNIKKDPNQREACGCVVSKDIGSYDTCLMECRYCYATSSFKTAVSNYKAHDPESPVLLPGKFDIKAPETSDSEAPDQPFLI